MALTRCPMVAEIVLLILSFQTKCISKVRFLRRSS